MATINICKLISAAKTRGANWQRQTDGTPILIGPCGRLRAAPIIGYRPDRWAAMVGYGPTFRLVRRPLARLAAAESQA